MLQVVWNVVKYLVGVFLRVIYPAKRLVCRRRKNSASDVAELTSIGTGDGPQMNSSVSGSLPHNAADLDMEPWDSWGGSGNPGQPGPNSYGHPPAESSYQERPVANGQATTRKGSNPGSYHQHMLHKKQQQQQQQQEPELQLNFFEDMTPNVQRQKKFLIRKKETQETTTGFSTRLGITSDVPLQTSELESWEDTGNAWEDNAESAEDLSWQAEEAIREKRRKDRMERQAEQQRKKQKKDEMRGIRGGSLSATKLS